MGKRYKRYNKGMSKTSLALKLAVRNAKILSEQKPEVKYHDSGATGTVSAAGSSTVLGVASVAQGSSATERIGSSITLKSFNFRGYLQKSASATEATFVRMLVIQCMTDDAPTSSTIFNTTPYITAYRNMDHTTDFRVIMDKVFTLTQDSNVGKYIRLSIPAKRFPIKEVKYDEADTTGASSSRGKIYVMLTTEEATNVPSYTYQGRIRFIDN